MFLFSAVLATSSPCSPEAIAAAAVVTPERQEAIDAIGLSHVDGGFQRPKVQEIRWHGQCAPTVVGLYGGKMLATASGLTVSTNGGSTLHVRHDPIPETDPEPPHPEWKGHRFAGSASLMVGTWRVGLWLRHNGTSDIARYRPGDTAVPIILMTSAQPVIGVYYLGFPDSAGGTLLFAQRLGQARFRTVAMNWSEASLRTSGR